MAERRTRKLQAENWRCPSCGGDLHVIVDEDDNPILDDGDAQAICRESDCFRSHTEHINHIPLRVAKTAFQAEV